MRFHPAACLQSAYRAVSEQPRDGQRADMRRGGLCFYFLRKDGETSWSAVL